MTVQITRRFCQGATLLLVVAMACLSLYAHYRSARVIDDEVLMAGLRGEILARAIHPCVERLADPQAFLDDNHGTLWSMRLMGLSISDPLAGVEAVAASGRVHGPLLLSLLIPVVATLVLGKVFCSWMCPGYLLFELTGKLRKLLRLAEIKPAEVHFAHANKYVLLLVGVGLAAVFGAPLFALIYPPAVISRVLHAWIFGTQLAGMLLILGVIIAFEVFVSPRWWCRTVCPGGALYGLLGWGRLLRVRLEEQDCTGCQACVPVCEAGINPITQSDSIECDNCGVCLNHCHPGALVYTVGLPRRSGQGRRGRGGTAALVGVTLACLFVPTAAAHHVLGLPHYSYKENYPQRPTLEYPATTGPYDVLLTSYPGNPVPGEPANLAFYIKNRNNGRVYAEPISVRVLQTSTFGDNQVILPATSRPPFDNQHKFQCTFPVDAEYIVELSVQVEGRLEIIPFAMVAGQPTATASIVIAAGLGAIGLFVVVRAVHIKRRRAARRQALPIAVPPGEPHAAS